MAAIRRHVHFYYLCPGASAERNSRSRSNGRAGIERATWACGLVAEGDAEGDTMVWRHRFQLAGELGSIAERDRYVLNEHWHSAFQDGVV